MKCIAKLELVTGQGAGEPRCGKKKCLEFVRAGLSPSQPVVQRESQCPNLTVPPAAGTRDCVRYALLGRGRGQPRPQAYPAMMREAETLRGRRKQSWNQRRVSLTLQFWHAAVRLRRARPRCSLAAG